MVPDLPIESSHEARGGSLHLGLYPGGILVATVKGHLGSGLLAPYLRALSEVARTGRAVGFHDWFEMTGYDSAVRKSLTDWAIRNRKAVQEVHILVRHRLVAMGVATGSLLVGRELVKSYADVASFRVQLRKRLEGVVRDVG